MALFSRKKDTTAKGAVPAAEKSSTPKITKALATDYNLAMVLQSPRITEKTVGLGERNVYTFVVHSSATKRQVKSAVQSIYNVTPVKVNIVNKKARQTMSRKLGRKITEKGMKKAYVYLKDGDSITLV